MTKALFKVCLFFLTFFFLLAEPAFPQSQSLEIAVIKQKLQAKLDSIQKMSGIPGAVFSCILEGGQKISIASGLSQLEKPKKMPKNAHLLAGSIGKTFFAALSLMLVEEGKLDLDAPIKQYLGKEPWFDQLPNAHTISVKMLLNHSSGIQEYYELGDFMQKLKENPDRVWKAEDLIAYVWGLKPLFEAGKDWSYADTNYLILGIILEKITGKSVYEEVKQRIIAPLRLKNTFPSVSRELDGLVCGYSMPNSPFGFSGAMIVQGQLVLNPQFEWTGGGYVSSVDDLSFWIKSLMEEKVLNQSMLALMKDGLPAKTGKNHAYGLGLQIRPYSGGTSYGHGGWFPGYLSEMAYFPEYKIAAAFQINTDDFGKLKQSPYFYLLELVECLKKG
ncbi:MAG: serine hydrolase domain-containing protein [Microscillaceae bacterium]|nr:serine hydrolase domain-containing protein [Microscillaceae bacterium]